MNGCGRSRQTFTYSEVGATAAAALPVGYQHLLQTRQIGVGEEWFLEAAQRLTSWDMHRRAGLQVDADFPVSRDQTVVLGMRFGLLRINAPVRVVYLVEEGDTRGFAYGTLPSHPEVSEERFAVRIDDDGIVWGEIRAFSRPGRWFTHLGGSLARRVQHATTRKYLEALMADRWLPCPCCGHHTLPERGAYEVCPVCYWEDDPHQQRHPDSADGANGTSLIDSQQTYQRIGAVDEIFVDKVRPARGRESLDDD